MKNALIRFLPALALLLLPGPLAAAQAETETSRQSTTIRYEIRYLDLHAVEVLAWDQCTQKEKCRVGTVGVAGDPIRKGFLEVTAEPAVQEKVAHALARLDTSPRTRSFQVLLLAASTKPNADGPEVPANAKKALADLKGFLSFKSYEVLDTGWLSATQERGAEGRLMGRQGAGYGVVLHFRDTGSPEDHTLFVDTFRLKVEPFMAPGKMMRPGFTAMDTSFSLKEGETIVVGSSRGDSPDEALVVLLTAVPAS